MHSGYLLAEKKNLGEKEARRKGKRANFVASVSICACINMNLKADKPLHGIPSFDCMSSVSCGLSMKNHIIILCDKTFKICFATESRDGY